MANGVIRRRIARKVLGWLLQGVVVVTPLLLTLYLLWLSFSALNQWLFFALGQWLSAYLPGDYSAGLISLLGLAAIVGLLILVGAVTGNVLGHWLLALPGRLMQRMPVIKLLYGAIRDLMQAFMGSERKFDRPVRVRLGPGVHVLGFVTSEDLTRFDCAGQVAVYLPQSFNFAGNLLVVDADTVEPLACSSAELMSFIVSGGVVKEAGSARQAPPAEDAAS